MQVEGVPYDHGAPWPGSSDPLSRSVVSFCSPSRGLVTADPTFELAGRTAEWLKVPVTRVPLKPDYTHDVKAMLAADAAAGLFYICTANSPTGTVNPARGPRACSMRAASPRGAARCRRRAPMRSITSRSVG